MNGRRRLRSFRLRYHRLLTVGLLAVAVAVTMIVGAFSGPTETAQETETASSKNSSSEREAPAVAETSAAEEMRGVWVPMMSLQMEKPGEEAFQKKFDNIIQVAQGKGMNALIVHVRPYGDALYPSEYFPWSHIVSGTQGVDPGFDPLAYMVEATHQAGMEFHAWVNPLRIQSGDAPSILSQDNPYHQWKGDEAKKGWTVKTDSGIYYNPAYEGVRSYIAEGVAEIVRNYDVDGVQFDDYFYPTQDASFDKAAYEAYTAASKKAGDAVLSLEDWRKANINALVSLVYQKIKAENPEVVFGISPQGNLSNDEKMGADVATWCAAKGYLDYICPQMYVNFENDALPFTSTLETWKSLIQEDSIELYVGLAAYKAGSDVDDGTWKNADDILARQVSAGRELDCSGFLFYSWDYLDTQQTQAEMENVMKVLG